MFVSDPAGRRIAVFGALDMRHRRDLPFANPGRIVVDTTPEQALWVIDRAAKRVVRLDGEGRRLGDGPADVVEPVALAVDPRQGDLLIADAAPDRIHVRRYRAGTWTHLPPAIGRPFWSAPRPGMAEPGRFFRLRALACDAEGHIYVADHAVGARLHKLTPDGRTVWVREGLEFVSCADLDPGDEQMLYSRAHRYRIDPAKPPGESWRLDAVTIDPVRYPQDPRLNGEANLAVRMHRIDGRLIMAGRAQMAAPWWFWRFDGDIAVPAAAWFPAKQKGDWPPGRPDSAFVWSDDDGDGAMQAGEYRPVPAAWFTGQSAHLDPALGLHCTTGTWDAAKGAIQRIPFAGLNTHGAPTWDVAAITSVPIPVDTGIQRVSKLAYDPVNDRMYLGCWTAAHPHPGGGWEQMVTGAVLQRFDAWSTAPRLAWERLLVPPEGVIGKTPKAWSFKTDHAFVASTWKHKQIAVDVWRLDDGVRVGRLLPTPCIGGVTGWIDMNDAVQSHRRRDGSYLVTAEEVWMAKGLWWEWKP